MRILSIETSCDETAISIIEAVGTFPHATYTIQGNALFSQIDIHREYGGVFPMVAKREHAKMLVPVLLRALREADLLIPRDELSPLSLHDSLHTLLAREESLIEPLSNFFDQYEKPPIDLIAVTQGPGLEPTLWVGINFARALSQTWGMPVVPVNHMEGHILSSIFDGRIIPELAFPVISLLISGGHTELVLMREWGHHEKIGETRDDAVGEAFDKVARMLDLPYPGGPEIGRLAAGAREKDFPLFVQLPRPMLDSGDLAFSFSGLKTAVRYAVQDKKLTHQERAAVAREFEDAVTTVLLRKTKMAVDLYGAQTIIIGGGVSANSNIRNVFTEYFWKAYPMVTLYLPSPILSTDNSVMIALAGHAQKERAITHDHVDTIVADGNLSLTS